MQSPIDPYPRIYEQELADEARWLAYGAVAKVDSVEQLVRRANLWPHTVVELGCGTGAVIRECRRRGIGRDHVAVDQSREALDHLATTAPDVQCIEADLASPTFALAASADLVVLSHVLEHLPAPLALLRRLDAPWIFVEVPLEDLPGARLKGLFRDRHNNPAGHIQFFTAASARDLLGRAGLQIVAERQYAPVVSSAMLGELARRNHWSRVGTAARFVTSNVAPRLLGSLWRTLYYAHYAALCYRSP